MDANTGKFIAQQLYPDLKTWIATFAKKLTTPVKKAKSPLFKTPSDILNALKANKLQPDGWVTIECKPFQFGPFLRNHFLSPIVGSRTDMRLGPPLASNHPIMAIVGQVTSHLKPVGLYPPIDDDLYQICLYPSDSNICGMVGLMPGVNNLIEYIPAVTSAKNLTFSGVSCHAKGIVRQVSPKLLTDVGAPIEKWEELRQEGKIWFLDLSSEDSECTPLGEAVTTEMWGAMYASGHLEIKSGKLKLQSIVDGTADALKSQGFDPHVTQNQAGRQEIMVFSKGIRALIDTKAPLFSVHMDAEIAIDFKTNRENFDRICQSMLNHINESCKSQSVELVNPLDLDFSYTNSSKSFTVLKSIGSEYISDPLAVAIRDWHRKRGK